VTPERIGQNRTTMPADPWLDDASRASNARELRGMVLVAALYAVAGIAAAVGSYLTHGIVALALAVVAGLLCAAGAWTGLWAVGISVILYTTPSQWRRRKG
jgi:hypothetical protein